MFAFVEKQLKVGRWGERISLGTLNRFHLLLFPFICLEERWQLFFISETDGEKGFI
jgi:hypothetical protein